MPDKPQQQDLPKIIEQYLQRISRRIRPRYTRSDVLAELRAHFVDALAETSANKDRNQLAVELIAEFGNTKILGKLIKRAKKCCRPMWVKFVIRTCQTLIVLMLIFAGYTYWFISGKPTIRVDYLAKLNEMVHPTADESLNAAPHYLKAIELLAPPQEVAPTIVEITHLPGCPLETGERKAMKKWIEANQPAIDQLRLGTAKPYCWFEYTSHARAEAEPGLIPVFTSSPSPLLITVTIPSLNSLRQLCFIFCWEMQFAADRGDWDLIVAHLKSVKVVAKHFMECPILIENLLGIAIDRSANDQLMCLSRAYRPPDRVLEELAVVMAQSFPQGYPIVRMDGEALFGTDSIQWLFTDNGSGDGHLLAGQWMELNAIASGEKVRSPDTEEMIKLTAGSMIHPSRRKTVELLEQWKQKADQYRSSTPYQNHITGYSVNAWSDKTIKENPRCFLAKMFLPSVERAVWESYVGKAKHEAAQTVVALLRYKVGRGQFPESLDELVPQYLKAVPQDPFGLGPLSYKRQNDDFVLYSWGLNFKDDSSQHNKDAFRIRSTTSDYVFWPPEAVKRPEREVSRRGVISFSR